MASEMTVVGSSASPPVRRLLRQGRPGVGRRIGFLAQPSAMWGLWLTVSVLCVVVIGPILDRNSPIDLIGSAFEGPSESAWLGTDILGRDVLSRILSGGGEILALSAVSTLLGVTAGAILGLAAGYVRGVADDLIMRSLDVLLAFPQTILALLFVSMLGSSDVLLLLLIAAVHLPQVARVVRAATLRVAGEDFVLFAHAIGTPTLKIMVSEIAPNLAGPILVEVGLRFTYSIALISGLSFLGLAQHPPAANWGAMVNENRIGLMVNPWPVVIPIGLIAMLTVGVNLLTDAYAGWMGRRETIVHPPPDAGQVGGDIR